MRSPFPQNVLVSSAGRRVALLRVLRESLGSARPGAWVGVVDSGFSAPARFVADHFWAVERCTKPGFENTIIQICQAHEIGLIVPTIDTELPVFANCRERLDALGIAVCVSGVATIKVACDKRATSDWLIANRFPTVRQTSPAEALGHMSDWKFPLIAKPHDGSASIGVQRINSEYELEYIANARPDYLIQEMAKGREFTINLFVNRQGKCVCAVPHWRMEVRAGEVSKGITVKDDRLMDLGRSVVEALPDARGPLNVQCFLDEDGTLAIIEINARFGGGYPLAHQAGARFTDWLLAEQEGREIAPFDDWTDDLAMLRYDDSVFVSGSSVTRL